MVNSCQNGKNSVYQRQSYDVDLIENALFLMLVSSLSMRICNHWFISEEIWMNLFLLLATNSSDSKERILLVTTAEIKFDSSGQRVRCLSENWEAKILRKYETMIGLNVFNDISFSNSSLTSLVIYRKSSTQPPWGLFTKLYF